MGRVAFREGGNHPAGRPVADVTRYTPGKYVPLAQSPLRGDGVRMLQVSGEKAQFIFNDNVKATDDMGVGLMTRYSGADAIRVLAGGVVAEGAEIVFHISGTDGLPKAVEVGDGEVGEWVCGRANFGNSSLAEDVADSNGDYDPSLTIFLYDEGMMRQVGTETSTETVLFPVDLAIVDANDDIVLTWTPLHAGSILSDWFQVTEPVTTAAKAATFSLFINGVAVTGGVIGLTSANATPLGAVVNGSAITALNVFDANDVITMVVSGLTAFDEGEGAIGLRVTAPTSQT